MTKNLEQRIRKPGLFTTVAAGAIYAVTSFLSPSVLKADEASPQGTVALASADGAAAVGPSGRDGDELSSSDLRRLLNKYIRASYKEIEVEGQIRPNVMQHFVGLNPDTLGEIFEQEIGKYIFSDLNRNDQNDLISLYTAVLGLNNDIIHDVINPDEMEKRYDFGNFQVNVYHINVPEEIANNENFEEIRNFEFEKPRVEVENGKSVIYLPSVQIPDISTFLFLKYQERNPLLYKGEIYDGVGKNDVTLPGSEIEKAANVAEALLRSHDATIFFDRARFMRTLENDPGLNPNIKSD